ncbi:MAG: hypothetical protein DRJ38_04635 [Thermoprotei archaeon]|nr:MAG: hypothetical protein DRJ38_04635 [Thermoprotei archaeon]
MVKKAVILCLLAFFLLSLYSDAVLAEEALDLTLYWVFDNATYCIKDVGKVELELENKDKVIVRITWIGVHFEWEEKDYYFALDLSSNPIEISPGEKRHIGVIEFEVYENAKIGKNLYYFLIQYEYWNGREWVSREWYTEDFEIYVAEPVSVTWWLGKEKTSYFKGEKIIYTLNITNNCNRCIRISSVGARGDWFPTGVYYFIEYPEPPIINPGDYLLLTDLDLEVPKTAEVKWHNIETVVCYEVAEDGGWSETECYPVPEWYAIEVLERKLPIPNLANLFEILSGVGAAIGFIIGLFKKFAGKKDSTPPPPPPQR